MLMETNWVDITGELLSEGDYVLFSRYKSSATLRTGVIKQLRSSHVRISSNDWRQTRICHYPQYELLKLTKEQYNKIKE